MGGALGNVADAQAVTDLDGRDDSGWDSFLTRLERELAEMLLESTADTAPDGAAPDSDASDSRPPVGQVWTPPSGLGPLPAQLEVRARALLSATSNVCATLALRHFDIGRHLAAVRSVPSAASSRPPVYLDVAG